MYIDNAGQNNLVYNLKIARNLINVILQKYVSVLFISHKKDIILIDILKLLPQVI